MNRSDRQLSPQEARSARIEALAGVIRLHRQIQGIEHHELAARLRWRTEQVRRVETGELLPSVLEFVAIARALRECPYDLIGKASTWHAVRNGRFFLRGDNARSRKTRELIAQAERLGALSAHNLVT